MSQKVPGDIFLSLSTLLKVYDFLCENDSKALAVELITRHAPLDEIVYVERDNQILGVAVFWQIDDPNDIVFPADSIVPMNRGEETASGKYVYLPFILVHPEVRGDLRVVRDLLDKCVKRAPGARRIAFRRIHSPKRKKRFGTRHPERVHVMETPNGTDNSQEKRHKGTGTREGSGTLHVRGAEVLGLLRHHEPGSVIGSEQEGPEEIRAAGRVG